ncbi:hypothetical protein GETHLI_16450 [Geothrix limicola]|uniref:DUF1573 domain-containing protein n=1 Tax=Geothrix limicola TaxID=2927978 RepID=A0ABQ5QF03_9BACT|nr:hypothetical protein [Geothrix limicola]GLH73143.1 hypothetical protein GETHLI_16450 [Geothrix limicola]
MLILPALVMIQAPVPVPAAKPDPVPLARIELTTPFPVHLGSVGPREAREALFGIRSTHDRPFRFRVLDLSLGLSLDEAQLAAPMQPGEVRTLRLKVDPSGLEGPIKGAVRLGTDDPAQPNYILRYDMTVRPEVAVDNTRKSLGDVAPHETPEARFHFTREGGDPLKLVLAGELPPHLAAELVHEGTTADLRVTLRPNRLKPGTTAGLEVLKVETNGPRQPQFTLYLDWRIATPVVPTPSRLVFTDLKTTLLGLELAARDGKPFRILGAEIQGRGFELIDAPGPEAVRHTLRVRRTGRQTEAVLVLRCSNQETPLQVPLRFLDPGAPATPEPRP